MKIYAKVGYPEQILANRCPAGFIEMQTKRPKGDWHATENGRWAKGNPYTEEIFIRQELVIINQEIEKHVNNSPLATATEQDWRNYRLAIRYWIHHPHFPNPRYRPQRPVIG